MSRYNEDTLRKFCEEFGVYLLNDYTGKLKRETKIEGCCMGIGDCTNTFIVTLRALLDDHAYYCTVCRQALRMEKIKKTNQERYNVDTSFQREDVREKSKATNLAKYGYEYAGSSPAVHAQITATVKSKYNVDNVFQLAEVKEKIKDHNQAKHGVDNISQVPATRDKARETMKERFGYEYATQSPELLEKTKETNLAKYNTEWCITSKVVKDKVKATTKERYGHEHHNQNAEVAARASKTAYKAKDYTLPSGKVIRLQGYEPFCMDELLTVTTEDDIVTSRTEVPEIWYELNGKKHRYYVDIYVKSKDLCIEVKSTWTVKRDKEKIAAIREATKQMGIKYRVAVYSPKGERVQLIKK